MAQPPSRSNFAAATNVSAVGAGPYRINVAAALSGVAPTTLRAWERRYGIPVPRRTTAAYRLYSAEDVLLVTRMRELVDSGVAPAEAARGLLSTGASLPIVGDEPVDGDSLLLAREKLIGAAQRWDERAIDEELTRLSFLVDAQTLYAKVVSPLLVEVGRRWKAGVLSIAQEHLLSEKLELALRGALRTLERAEGPHVILASLGGDPHVLGLLGAALRFAGGGARVTLFGALTPPSAIADAVRSMAPRLVGLSATLVPNAPRALFKEYAKACGSTRWLVGGEAASSVAAVIESAGGLPIAGPASAWGPQVRNWLRGGR